MSKLTPRHASLALDLLLGGGDFDAEDPKDLATAAALASVADDPDLCAQVEAMLDAEQRKRDEATELARQREEREACPLSTDELLGVIRRGDLPPCGLTDAEGRSLRLVPEENLRAAIAAGREVLWPRWVYPKQPAFALESNWEQGIRRINPDRREDEQRAADAHKLARQRSTGYRGGISL